MVVADTGAILALLDADDRHHTEVLAAFKRDGDSWVLPWATLPEIDYLASKYLGSKVSLEFNNDVAAGAFRVEGFNLEDIKRAVALQKAHASLGLGLVDSVVMAQAVRLKATAIATLDARHFRAVRLDLEPAPRLIPLDR